MNLPLACSLSRSNIGEPPALLFVAPGPAASPLDGAMFDRVLLLTDLGDQPELTFSPVRAISEVCGSKVIVFHAVRGSSDLVHLGGASQVRELLDEKAQSEVMPKLEIVADRLEDLGVNTGIVTRIGSTFDVAVRAIKDLDIDLVVIPQEGFADFTKRIGDSTTARIIRETDVPVLTINESFLKRMDKWNGFSRILTPVDFQAGGLDGIPSCEAFAAEFGGTLELVHVVTPIHQQVLDTPEGDILLPKDMYYNIKSRLEAKLSNAAHRVGKVPSYWRLLEDNKPGSGVMSYADRLGADLIIVPPVSRSGVRTTLLGSVAEHVIKHARCPVLTLHSGSLE